MWQSIDIRVANMPQVGNTSLKQADLAASWPGNYLAPWMTRIRATEPLYGEGEFVLAFGVSGLQVGDLVSINPSTGATTRTLVATRGIIAVSMAANIDTTALSWFQVFGTANVRCTTAASAGLPLYQSATAGTVLSTVAATGLVLGMASASATGYALAATKNCNLTSGSIFVNVPNLDGLFVGMTLSGTGVSASQTIAAIGQGGQYMGVATPNAGVIQLSAAATATGLNAVTFTATGWALAAIAYPSSVGLG
jgi:hypothetical protein